MQRSLHFPFVRRVKSSGSGETRAAWAAAEATGPGPAKARSAEVSLPPLAPSDEGPVAAPGLAKSAPTRARRVATPEDMLERALRAAGPAERARWAAKGLASRAPLDPTTRAMLLRQLYLAELERRRFEAAYAVAEQIIASGVLPDVAHQDAARAAHASGDLDGTLRHLRLAARFGPPRRRAFHFWTLGSVLFLAERYTEAESAMTRALRWGTTDKPLYEAHLALIEAAAGRPRADLATLRDRLEAVPAGQGYGRFVLGQLAYQDGDHEAARRHLEAFVRRTGGGRVALAIALAGELDLAQRTLTALAATDRSQN